MPITTGQVAVGTSAVQLVDDRVGREQVLIRNMHATNVLYVGAAGVTTGTGHAVPAGSLVELDTDGEVYAVASAVGTTTTFCEVFS